MLTALEVCAGAGGAALGVAQAGFQLVAAAETDRDARATLAWNRPEWPLRADLRDIDGRDFAGIDLLSGGVPCQPFSSGGRQLGAGDDRDLFPAALRLIHDARPRAVLLENVPGLAQQQFAAYRAQILAALERDGYDCTWATIRACDYGVPQLRPRFVLVAMQDMSGFRWPAPSPLRVTVGDVLLPLMAERGWPAAREWAAGAQRIAPTITGNAGKTGGGPDLGQSRAKREWLKLGVNALGIAESAPGPDGVQQRGFRLRRRISLADGRYPMLTVPGCALLQGFPGSWHLTGSKTHAYRQVAEAFPPPVARALAEAIRTGLESGYSHSG